MRIYVWREKAKTNVRAQLFTFKKAKTSNNAVFSLVRAVEALTPKLLSQFWGPHEPKGSTPPLLIRKVLLNKKSVYTTHITMVRAVGVEPTRFPTCPLNKRVCHSATLAHILLLLYKL